MTQTLSKRRFHYKKGGGQVVDGVEFIIIRWQLALPPSSPFIPLLTPENSHNLKRVQKEEVI